MQSIGFIPSSLRGVVAHSHGELVAAELLQNYPYIFEDNAHSRPLNVVSIGSPYKGSKLANKSSSEIGRLIVFAGIAPGCPIPSEMRTDGNINWRSNIGWRAKNQISAWNTSHRKSYWFRNKGCSPASFDLLSGQDDGVISENEGRNFADGGDHYYRYSGYCHSDVDTIYLGLITPWLLGEKIEGNDQWHLPEFVSYVNNFFHSDHEIWQPF